MMTCYRMRVSLVFFSLLSVVGAPLVAYADPPVMRHGAPGEQQLEQQAIPIGDIALTSDRSLQGVFINEQGEPIARAAIELSAQGGDSDTVLQVLTDDEGRFSVQIEGGLYQIRYHENMGVMVRAWSPGTAPPAAHQQILLVSGQTVRGNYAAARFLSNPWVITGVVLTAILVPVILEANRDDREDASGQ